MKRGRFKVKKVKKVTRRIGKKVGRGKKKEPVGQIGVERGPVSQQKTEARPDLSSGEGEREIASAVPEVEKVEGQVNTPPVDKEEGQEILEESTSTVIELLGFYLADEEYAIEIGTIKEIIKPLEITEVPRTPSFVKGIISLRGLVIPVFDLRERIGLKDRDFTKKNRIIVVFLNESTIGLLVDSVTEVVRLKKDEIEPPPATVSAVDAEYINGVGRYKGRMIILLGLERVLRLEESIVEG